LEQVVIAPVEQRYVDALGSGQEAGRRETPEATPDDDDPMPTFVGRRHQPAALLITPAGYKPGLL
jgi:hypothetical protein